MERVRAIEWIEGRVRLLDQTRLPHQEEYLETADYRDIGAAIREMRLRGAPLIGIAAAYGLALAGQAAKTSDKGQFLSQVGAAARELAATRPTAVNLCWALGRLLARAEAAASTQEAKEALTEEALRIHREDIEANRRIGRHGAALLPERAVVLTHCNTGSLATGGYGTALGVIRAAWEAGKLRRVYATETRPLLQGARLTAWELKGDGIPVTLIADGAAGLLLAKGEITAVVVGADRIAANGDVANKIGTYTLAVVAKEQGVPFYVAAPTSSIDLSMASGDDIPLEERAAGEVTSLAGVAVAPPGIDVANPAFDVTPHEYIAAIITENGVAKEPYGESLAALCQREVAPRG